MSAFLLDQKVKWSSQSGGYSKTKTGVIKQVLLPEVLPDRVMFPGLYRGAGCGGSRNHVSYVVVSDGKPYWPLVKNLQPIVHDKTERNLLDEIERLKSMIKVVRREILCKVLTGTVTEVMGFEFEVVYDCPVDEAPIKEVYEVDKAEDLPKEGDRIFAEGRITCWTPEQRTDSEETAPDGNQ